MLGGFMEMKKHIIFDIETTGLVPYRNIITCICARDNEGNIFSQHNNGKSEESLIKDFLIWVNQHEDFQLISANGKSFDIPFLLIRAYINNISFG